MATNEQARKNHEELFPDHVSTLAVTDPDLIEVVTQLLPFIGYPRALNRLRAIDEVAPAYAE